MKVSNPHQPLAQQLHQTLRVLCAPEKMVHSPLCNSPLVRRQQQRAPTMTTVQALRQLLDQCRTTLHQQDPLAADLLYGRFWEGITAETMVKLDRPEPQSIRRFYQQQEQAICRLAQVWEDTERSLCLEQHKNELVQRLPAATYTTLFGMDTVTDQVVSHLTNCGGPAIVTIKGIGGIGKTAAAAHAVRKVLHCSYAFHEVVWISAKQEFLTQSGITPYRNGPKSRIRLAQIFDDLGEKLALPTVVQLPLAQKVARLATVLRHLPHLVIIDNLESVEDFQELVPWLAQLSEPTRFLLTSRQTVPSLARVVTVDLDELQQADAVALATHVAAEKGVFDCDGAAVYELVGGNPLAIILMVSLMRHLPPINVFAAVRSGATEDLYNYIYHQSWDLIRCPAKELLFTIQRAGDVAEWAWLTLVSDQCPATLQQTLTELMDLSLVYCQGGANGDRCYAIHRLTSTFLRTEILGWK